MFLESRFERAINRIRAAGPMPLRIELWNGRQFDFSYDPTVTIVVPELAALRYLIHPTLDKLGEAFVDGHVDVKGSLHDAFNVGAHLAQRATAATREGLRRFGNHTRDRDRRAIEYHYDVSNDFYALFLDANMVYSCAYYKEDGDSLETAQLQKLDLILDKLALRPGERFLDIGCGWGALVMRAAGKYGAMATGITLSRNQFELAQERIRAAGLEERCQVKLCDYRDLPDAPSYDKIASVGMFEHVGLRNLPLYFARIRRLLRDDGLVLNHGITSSDVHNRWVGMGAGRFIDRYVFPDGELPHIALVLREMSEVGLEAFHVESLRRHYARTCSDWLSRLDAARERGAGLVGEKRMRIWQIYLAGCAYGFENSWINIYQVLARKAPDEEFAPAQ